MGLGQFVLVIDHPALVYHLGRLDAPRVAARDAKAVFVPKRADEFHKAVQRLCSRAGDGGMEGGLKRRTERTEAWVKRWVDRHGESEGGGELPGGGKVWHERLAPAGNKECLR